MEIKSYHKKNGQIAYQFRLYLGSVNGKKRYIKRSGFSSRSQAREALIALQEDMQSKAKRTNKTFLEVYEEWLVRYERDVAESTAMKTRRNFTIHILPVLGNLAITDIKPKTLEKAVQDWSKKLKYSRKMLGLTRNVMDFAVLHEYIDSNPATSVSAPKIKRNIVGAKNFYDKNELQLFMKLVEQTEDIRCIALFRLLAFTGIRKGELMALSWDDINGNTLSITKAVTRTPAGLEIGPTKTKSSVRLVSLDNKTLDILNALHASFPDSKLLFEDDRGHILTPSLPRKWLLSIIKGSPLPAITIHGFRHTHASLLFESGLDFKQVQHRLGHSNVKTTMDVYTHITQSAVDDIATKFSSYIDF